MAFIIAVIQLVLFYTVLFIAMFAAFEIALYLISFVLAIIDQAYQASWLQLAKSPVNVLRKAHTAAAHSHMMRRFAKV